MSPSDPTRPARPRRFSALKPAIKRDKPEGGAADDEAVAPPELSSGAPYQKASDEARIAKVMARAGLCSRRDAEAWILEGRVAVNGATIASPALNVGPNDAVTVDGYPIDKPERTRLFLFNKARGLVTTARDPEGRPTVFDALPPEMPRVVTIGRLDINTEGLMLLTNDGGLARMLELPATGWIRRYRVRANGTTDQAQLDALAKGLTIEGVTYAGIAAKLDRVQGANLWLTMGLKEGKNREIKRVLEHLGLAVTRLIRISFGPFQLGELADNAVEEVRTRVLRDQLGSALAKAAGIDFDGPLETGRTEAAAGPEPKTAVRTREPRQPGSVRAKPGTLPEGPRRQTRRTETADRRGRAVTVERIATAGAARGERSDKAQGSRRDREPAPSGQAPTRAGSPPQGGRARDAEAPRSRGADDRPKGSRFGAPGNRDDRRAAPSGATRDRDDRRGGGNRPRAAEGSAPRHQRRPDTGGAPAAGRSRAAPARSRTDERGADTRPARSDERRPDGDRPSFKSGTGTPRAPRRTDDAGGGRSSRPEHKPGGRTGGGKPGTGAGGGKGRPPRRG